MSNFDRERAEKSLVTVYQSDDGTGMGVLTCNDLILTAAHCLPRLPDPNVRRHGRTRPAQLHDRNGREVGQGDELPHGGPDARCREWQGGMTVPHFRHA